MSHCKMPNRTAKEGLSLNSIRLDDDDDDDPGENEEQKQKSTIINVSNPAVALIEDRTVFAALPQELSMFTNPSSILDCLWLYSNLCYILCLFPFRIVRDKPWRYKVQRTTWQQVVCAILHLFFIFYWIQKWRSNDQVNNVLYGGSSTKTKTKDYFGIVLAIAEVSYVLALLSTAWTKALVFQQIANTYHQLAKFEEEEVVNLGEVDEAVPLTRLIKSYVIRILLSVLARRYVVGIILCSIYTCLGLYEFWDEYDDELRHDRELFGEDGYVANTTKQFFYLDSVTPPLFLVYFMSIFYAVTSLLYSLLLNLGNLFYAILALMLANLGNNFENLIALPDVTGRQVIGEYINAKDFVKYINKKLGLLTLFVVLGAIPYYATMLPYIFNNDIQTLERIAIAANLAHYGGAMYLASTLQEKLRKIQSWFAERQAEGVDTGVSSDQQRVVMDELAQDSVALSGFGFFAVTYPTIGRILQLLMTYGFIAGEGMSIGLNNITSAFENVASVPGVDLKIL